MKASMQGFKSSSICKNNLVLLYDYSVSRMAAIEAKLRLTKWYDRAGWTRMPMVALQEMKSKR